MGWIQFSTTIDQPMDFMVKKDVRKMQFQQRQRKSKDMDDDMREFYGGGYNSSYVLAAAARGGRNGGRGGRGGGHGGGRGRGRQGGGAGGRGSDQCLRCLKYGHWARDCTEQIGPQSVGRAAVEKTSKSN